MPSFSTTWGQEFDEKFVKLRDNQHKITHTEYLELKNHIKELLITERETEKHRIRTGIAIISKGNENINEYGDGFEEAINEVLGLLNEV